MDTYNSGQVYKNYASYHKEEMAGGAFSSIEITNYNNAGSDSWGLHVTARAANTTVTITFDPTTEVLAFSDAEITSATIYAKDGAIRDESSGVTYANIADTKIYSDAGHTTAVGTSQNGRISGQTYETYTATKGSTIYIRTTIDTTAGKGADTTTNRNKYYVRGFCVNGKVDELLTWNSSGVYDLTYKVPEDYDGGAIEITPIYYLKDTSANPIVTFRVTNFPKNQNGWGDTIYAYPFYGKLGGQNNAFGAYPGQPVVFNNGQYQIQIPQKSTAWDPYYSDANLTGSNNTAKATNLANTAVSGITLSNGYYDSVHKTVMGYGNNSASSDHVQTYDYGDFYKIFNEKQPVDNIVFDFKYRTKKHNLEDVSTTSTTAVALETKYGSGGNGFELLKNYHGRTVDLFGDPLSGDQLTATPVYAVSIGGVNEAVSDKYGVENIAGYYATEWVIYANTTGDTYTKITGGSKSSIPPEVLVLNNNSTSFNATTYPSADANHTITDWKTLYTNLEAYRGKPVYISYEAADAQQGQGQYYTGTGGATRNDGRWLYSKNNETITSNIKIQYSDDNGDSYTDLNTTTPEVSGLSASFTNEGAEGATTFTTTSDPDKTFNFEAKTTNANYKFVGWYMDDENKTLISSDNTAQTERSGSYTFIARFMQVTSGQLILSHSADKGTISGTSYTGSGTAKIGVFVKNGDDIVRTYDLTTSDITLDDKIIKSDSTYTIEVTLQATATGNDMLGTTVLANPSGGDATYFNASSDTTDGKTKTIVLNSFPISGLFSSGTQNVMNIIYHSYFTEAVFNYNLKFEFTDRFGNAKTFYRIGKLTAAEAANPEYVEVVSEGDHHNRFLLPAFYSKLAPHESNFGKNFSWTMTAKLPFTQQNNVYMCDNYIRSTQTANNTRTATFDLPYAHTNGVPANIEQVDKATSANYVLENLTYGEVVKGEDYVTAPKQLNDGGTVKNFQYWSMASTSAPTVEVARCYFYSFNFVAYDNYVITPVYDTAETPLGNGNNTPLTTISYLDTTRNQYTGEGTDTAPVSASAKDVLFNDFVLSYEYQGMDIYKNDSSSSNVSQIGYVVERVQKLEVKQDGTPYTDPSHYSAVSVKSENDIKSFISTNTSSDYKSEGTLAKYTLSKASLDNKNRIELAEAYTNAKGWNSTTQKFNQTSGYKNYVYKAYTYMIVDGTVYISSPAYFTMYEEAVQ
ncbi:hypothetical protein [Ruminococcus sp.]|uniref:hypothetical protein n=1 Tax=Ruminococcus sp. TaxID=41978 RepID=UPI0038701810